MAENKTDGRITEEQKVFARNLSNGMSLYDAYVNAYMNGSTPERTASNYTKKQLQNRASVMKNSKGVKMYLAQNIVEKDIETAGKLVWDRRKATDALMKMYQKAEGMLDVLEDATNSLSNKYASKGEEHFFYKTYSFGVDMLQKVSTTLLQIAQELNKMYGLGAPEIINQNAVQVIFGSTETLPPDKDLEGFDD